MIRNPRVMDDLHGCRKFPEATGSRRDADKELQGCIHAFSDHEAVLALRFDRGKISTQYNITIFCYAAKYKRTKQVAIYDLKAPSHR